ncbi:hypothetical protein B8W66_00045 [Mycobacterium decipiens]|uniref:Uncharacterized protein n=1 Tax=Mycobacterium decipiens TaxID=1430326 RepID=A0A1X2LZQ5_9MYCO|nr:hypothetical protein B8W66_00045 [Mycobacterium decipiens]
METAARRAPTPPDHSRPRTGLRHPNRAPRRIPVPNHTADRPSPTSIRCPHAHPAAATATTAATNPAMTAGA